MNPRRCIWRRILQKKINKNLNPFYKFNTNTIRITPSLGVALFLVMRYRLMSY